MGQDYDAAMHGFTDEVLHGVRRSRAIAWWFAGGCLVVAATSVAALAMIAPLKEVRPYVVIVDRATGAAEKVVEVQAVSLSEQDAVRQSELVSYVTDRETYHTVDNATRIPDVLRRSTDQAAESLRALWSTSNPEYPPNLHGGSVVQRVVVKSVTILNEGTAQVRFTKRREVAGERPISRDFVATLGFAFNPRVERTLEAVWSNPLGFTITSYRIDAETLSSREAD